VIKLETLYAFMESNFDYLLVVDAGERMVHMSSLFRRECYPGEEAATKLSAAKTDAAKAGVARSAPDGDVLEHILSAASLSTFRSAMGLARRGSHGIAIYSPAGNASISIPLKAGYARSKQGEVFLFFGDKVEGLSARSESDKDERVKELACFYRVIDWTEVSASVTEFFTHLPKYLSTGMVYPDEAVVYSVYQGVEYGQKPSSANFISVELAVGDKLRGEIRVGYLDDKHEILPEEQKMLDEIGRTLTVALERKEYREKLALMKQEEAEYNRRLADLSAEIDARTRNLRNRRPNWAWPAPTWIRSTGVGKRPRSGWRPCSRPSPTRWC
jgi:hypothetical protein